MRIGLTGADGFTGAYILAQLARQGMECVALSADLTEPEAVAAEVDSKPFDRLIHLAGEAFVASGDWRRFYAVNQLGTLTLLDRLAQCRPGMRCILASSAQVYGPGASGRIAEDYPPRPSNHYAFSKLAMEICADAFADQLEIVVTRPFNYTGVGQQLRYVIPKIVDHFRRRAPRIELGNVEVRRDFGDVRTVAEAYAGLVLADSPPSLVNIATGNDHSIREIVAMAEAVTGHSIAIEVNPAFLRDNEVPVLVGDQCRLKAALPSWQPRPFEETLEWMLAGG